MKTSISFLFFLVFTFPSFLVSGDNRLVYFEEEENASYKGLRSQRELLKIFKPKEGKNLSSEVEATGISKDEIERDLTGCFSFQVTVGSCILKKKKMPVIRV
eukprot:723216_1